MNIYQTEKIHHVSRNDGKMGFFSQDRIQFLTCSTTLHRHCEEQSKNKIYKKKSTATKQSQTHTAFNNEIASERITIHHFAQQYPAVSFKNGFQPESSDGFGSKSQKDKGPRPIV